MVAEVLPSEYFTMTIYVLCAVNTTRTYMALYLKMSPQQMHVPDVELCTSDDGVLYFVCYKTRPPDRRHVSIVQRLPREAGSYSTALRVTCAIAHYQATPPGLALLLSTVLIRCRENLLVTTA